MRKTEGHSEKDRGTQGRGRIFEAEEFSQVIASFDDIHVQEKKFGVG